MDYPIFYGEENIGSVTVQTQGLYTHFCCRCALPTGDICRIIAVYTEGTVDLGICIPRNGGFVTEKTVPTKRIYRSQPKFLAKSLQNSTAIQIDTKREFLQLHLLPNAKFDAGKKCLLVE